MVRILMRQDQLTEHIEVIRNKSRWGNKSIFQMYWPQNKKNKYTENF